MSDRDGHDEGVTATVNQTGPGAGRAGAPGRNGHGRGSSDRERQTRSAYLVGVLARALTAQVEELAGAAAATPDGWWFAEPEGSVTTEATATGGAGGAGGTDEREEHR